MVMFSLDEEVVMHITHPLFRFVWCISACKDHRVIWCGSVGLYPACLLKCLSSCENMCMLP